ncbi:hypothetical protein HanRHA438_Chr15g0709551 [Helianthus annuus]|nr:hypothetical protein HanRHA438_Chr15g0709551 [Helianthus annuus]
MRILIKIVILRGAPGSGSRIIPRILILTTVLFGLNIILQELRVGSSLSNVNKESVTIISHMHNQRWTLWQIWKLSTIQERLFRLNLLLFLKG